MNYFSSYEDKLDDPFASKQLVQKGSGAYSSEDAHRHRLSKYTQSLDLALCFWQQKMS